MKHIIGDKTIFPSFLSHFLSFFSTISGKIRSRVLCLVARFREDLHNGQLKETKFNSDKLVLHVQEEWKICRSPSTPQ
jgi:hypothetical protein